MKKVLAFALAALLVVAMAVPAMAATKSKEQETDPHVKQIEVDGKKVDFVVYDSEGKPIGNYSENGSTVDATDKDGNEASYQLLIVTYREKANFPGEIEDALDTAYAAWQAGQYAEITGDKVLVSLVYIGLKKTNKATGEVSYVGVNDIKGADSMLLQFGNGYTLAIFAQGNELVQVNDGDFIKLSNDGVVALFKDKTTGGGTGKSPQTGYESGNGIFVATALVASFVAVVGFCYIADKKRA